MNVQGQSGVCCAPDGCSSKVASDTAGSAKSCRSLVCERTTALDPYLGAERRMKGVSSIA
jgi:hypothetical protein